MEKIFMELIRFEAYFRQFRLKNCSKMVRIFSGVFWVISRILVSDADNSPVPMNLNQCLSLFFGEISIAVEIISKKQSYSHHTWILELFPLKDVTFYIILIATGNIWKKPREAHVAIPVDIR